MASARATVFGTGAEEYDRLRPGPAAEALDWVLPDRRSTVVDLAAGTGLVTRALIGRAERVVAVEPDPRMLARLVHASRRASGRTAVAAVRGVAEELPIADGTADAVLAGSAWHWFDPERTITEIARVLRPGGVLALMWSHADPSVAWVREVREIGRSGGSAAMVRRGLDVELPPGAPFGAGQSRYVVWRQAMRRDDVAAMVATSSGVLTLPETEREDVRRRARAHLDEALPDLADPVEVPFRTACWRAVRD